MLHKKKSWMDLLIIVFVVAAMLLMGTAHALDCNLDGAGGSLPTSADVELLATRIVADDLTGCASGNCNYDAQGGNAPTVGDVAKLLEIATAGTDPGNVCAEVVPAMPVTSYVTHWGATGSGTGQFRNPRGLLFDEETKLLYVADASNDRIQALNEQGNVVSVLGPTLTQGIVLSLPEDICKSPADGRFGIVDRGNSRVIIYSGSMTTYKVCGSFGTGEGQLWEPKGCAFDQENNIYVTDSTDNVNNLTNHKLVVFRPDCSVLRSLGSKGSALGQMNLPSGILLTTGGDIVLTEQGQGRGQVFTPGGTAVRLIGASGTGDSRLIIPSFVAQDDQGRLYFTDSDSRIKVFTTKGTLIGGFADPGEIGVRLADMAFPIGIALTRAGRVYVSDKDRDQIHVWDIQY